MGNREWETGNGKPGMGTWETPEPWEPRKLPNPGKPGMGNREFPKLWETLGNLIIPETGKLILDRNWKLAGLAWTCWTTWELHVRFVKR